MNYRLRAFILSSFFIGAGASVLIYIADQAETFTSPVAGGTVVFMGLGLLLVGALIMFATPQSLVAAEIVDRAIAPYSENLALIVGSLSPETRAIHVPNPILGDEFQVILILTAGAIRAVKSRDNPPTAGDFEWSTNRKALEPVGFELMKGYEKVLKSDFFGLDTQQLAGLLKRAVGPEFQLASAFSLRELSPDQVEAVWTKPTIAHTCLAKERRGYPELCCLCSSVACSLAKAAGKPVSTEESKMDSDNLTVTTRYLILSA